MRPILFAAALLSALAAMPAGAASSASLSVRDGQFVLASGGGVTRTSRDLVGAELTTAEGLVFRIDAVAPAADRPAVLLHQFSARTATGQWQPLCETDAQGRQAGFPMAGRWDRRGHYVRDAKAWFLTCTSGSQGKCVLWGYDPWRRGPGGADLTPLYRACQFAVRANYDGQGAAHTRNGTSIDVADVLQIQRHDTLGDPGYAFEAGWGPAGAVCVARTRWPDLLGRDALLAAKPTLAGTCDPATARRRGAVLFTRVKIAPAIPAAAPTPAPRRASAAPLGSIRAPAQALPVRLFTSVQTMQADPNGAASIHAVTAGIDWSFRRAALRAHVAADFNGGGRLAYSTRALVTSTIAF